MFDQENDGIAEINLINGIFGSKSEIKSQLFLNVRLAVFYFSFSQNRKTKKMNNDKYKIKMNKKISV